jgi:Zn finger protein HypA/HybF involved in hydrogenase expression
VVRQEDLGMNATGFIHSLGAMGLFPSRAFVPAFLTSLALRFGPEIAIIKNSGVLSGIGTAPSWFTSDLALIVLGVLALVEIIATKSPEAREVMNEVDHYLKAGMAALTTYGVLSVTDRDMLNAIRTGGALNVTDMGLAAAVGAGVLTLASLRRSVMGGFIEADADDHIGLQKLMMWAEDAWVTFGFLLLLIYPMLVLVLAAAIGGMYYGVNRYMQHRAEKQKVPCTHCQTPVHASALYCPHCKAERKETRAIGFFGSARNEMPADRGEHALALLTKKRCPCCAARFEKRAARQDCASCGHKLFNERATQDAYLATIDRRLPNVLGVSALLGLVPFVGMIAALIYFRVQLVAPFRQYIGFGTGFFVKWFVRILNLMLILLQLVPLMGLIVVPLMAYTNYRVYRGVFVSALNVPLAPALPAVAFQPGPAVKA